MFPEQIFPCPNYNKGRQWPITLIVIHATRSGQTYGSDWDRTVGWFGNPEAQASSHILVGKNGHRGRFVADEDTAWGATYLNARSLHVEQEQRTTDEPYPDEQAISTADTVRGWCNKFGIPKVRVFDENQHGIIGHEDSAQGKSFGKSDPGYMFPWDRFMELVNMDELTFNTLKLQVALVLAIAQGRFQDAFNILKYVGVK